MNIKVASATPETPPGINGKTSKREQGSQACLACRHRKQKCDETRPACGPCIKRNLPCEYAFEKGIRRQQGVERTLREDLRCAQAEMSEERKQRVAMEIDLQQARWMLQQQRDQQQIQQDRLNEADMARTHLHEYQHTLLRHLHMAQEDLHEARKVALEKQDQCQNLQNEARIVAETHQESYTFLALDFEDTQRDLLKLASLLNSLRSQSDLTADSLLKSLRQGHYDWALMETLDWRREMNANKPYPWHNWYSVEEYTTKSSSSSSANASAEQRAKPRSSASGICLPNAKRQTLQRAAESMHSPPPDDCTPLESRKNLPIARCSEIGGIQPPPKKRSLGGVVVRPIAFPTPSIKQDLPSISIESLLAPKLENHELPWLTCDREPVKRGMAFKHPHSAVRMDPCPTARPPGFHAAASSLPLAFVSL